MPWESSKLEQDAAFYQQGKLSTGAEKCAQSLPWDGMFGIHRVVNQPQLDALDSGDGSCFMSWGGRSFWVQDT